MFKRTLVPVWIGIILMSGMFLMGQGGWGPADECDTALDCPDDFRREPTCSTPSTCQGDRMDATCENHTCGSTLIDDDTACDSSVLSDPCGLYADIYCSGGDEQPITTCPTSCTDNLDCDSGAICSGNECTLP